MSTNWKSQIESAAYDLTHMEVNTIISSDVTAAKTPSRPRELLHKLAIKYDEKLSNLRQEYELDAEPETDSEEMIKRSGFGSFEEFIERSTHLEQEINNASASVDKLDEDIQSDLSILHRIKRNAQEIMDILYQKDAFIYLDDNSFLGNRSSSSLNTFNDLPPSEKELIKKKIQKKKLISLGDLSVNLSNSRDSKKENSRDKGDLDLDLRQLSLMKKAFDIGTSKVALQTIIGLDGDVTTRIAKSFADNQIPLVNDLHHDGIKLSVNYWKTLIIAITQFGEFIIGKISK